MIIKKIKDVIEGKASIAHGRSSKWPSVRKKHLDVNPVCALCAGKDKLEVHHIKPFHEHPELELEPTNLITLCESYSYGICCHRTVGHLGNYKKINPHAEIDAKIWNEKLTT